MAADTVRGARKVGRYTLLVVLAAIVLFPIYAVLLQALKTGPGSLDHPRSLLPVDLTFSTIRAAWNQGHLGRLLLNSVFVSIAVTVGVVITSLLAAYAFAFLEFPWKGPLFIGYLATMLVPAEVTVVINERTADSLGWINTYQGLIVPSLASTFGVFLVRQVFLQLPSELREASALDGVGHLRFLWEVAAPLSRPTLGALGLFTSSERGTRTCGRRRSSAATVRRRPSRSVSNISPTATSARSISSPEVSSWQPYPSSSCWSCSSGNSCAVSPPGR